MPKVIVYHSYYGCDTGCCGHTVKIVPDGEPIDMDNLSSVKGREEFMFSHPANNKDILYARAIVEKAFGAKHVADLDWDHCLLIDD